MEYIVNIILVAIIIGLLILLQISINKIKSLYSIVSNLLELLGQLKDNSGKLATSFESLSKRGLYKYEGFEELNKYTISVLKHLDLLYTLLQKIIGSDANHTKKTQ